jgi:putative hydrolase of the HAD superfamily
MAPPARSSAASVARDRWTHSRSARPTGRRISTKCALLRGRANPRDAARNGIDVAVLTNLTTRVQLEKLAALGLEDRIDLLLTSEETGREKPGSVMFTLPLSRLDPHTAEAVMVGDDVEAGVAAGNAVRLETVLFDPDGDSNADRDGKALKGNRRPDHSIDSFPALTEVL